MNKIFFLVYIMVQAKLPYVTKFPSALFFVDEMVKIIHLDLFLRAQLCLTWLIFAESPKMNKILKFYTRENLVPQRYVSWPQWIEKLHFIDKVGV